MGLLSICLFFDNVARDLVGKTVLILLAENYALVSTVPK